MLAADTPPRTLEMAGAAGVPAPQFGVGQRLFLAARVSSRAPPAGLREGSGLGERSVLAWPAAAPPTQVPPQQAAALTDSHQRRGVAGVGGCVANLDRRPEAEELCGGLRPHQLHVACSGGDLEGLGAASRLRAFRVQEWQHHVAARRKVGAAGGGQMRSCRPSACARTSSVSWCPLAPGRDAGLQAVGLAHCDVCATGRSDGGHHDRGKRSGDAWKRSGGEVRVGGGIVVWHCAVSASGMVAAGPCQRAAQLRAQQQSKAGAFLGRTLVCTRPHPRQRWSRAQATCCCRVRCRSPRPRRTCRQTRSGRSYGCPGWRGRGPARGGPPGWWCRQRTASPRSGRPGQRAAGSPCMARGAQAGRRSGALLPAKDRGQCMQSACACVPGRPRQLT